MEPVHPIERWHGDGNHDGVDVTSWVSVCPRGLWKVQRKRTTSSTNPSVICPRLGSLCRVRVLLKADTNEQEMSVCEGSDQVSITGVTEFVATPFPRCKMSVVQVPLGDWITLRLGEGQCDVTEACLEGMRAGEKCEILLSPVENAPQPSYGNGTVHATVELQDFTPGKESWEMLPSEKWEWAKLHKERGGVRFRAEDVWGAADSYSKALKLLIPLHGYLIVEANEEHDHEEEEQGNAGTTDERRQLPSVNEFKTIKAELHSNLSLCQLKLNQPEQAKASAAKATQLDPSGAKAWYRLGKACQVVNELEEAKQAFQKLLELQPEMPAALKALKDIANREKESDAQLGLRLSRMFT
ncbi:FK506-binding protein-like isoform 2-T2 [Pholidichthys leucotaenia]